jgi:hypothetical protein
VSNRGGLVNQLGIAGEVWTTYDPSSYDFRQERDDDRLQPRRAAALTVGSTCFNARTKPGEGMEPIADARREAALEIQSSPRIRKGTTKPRSDEPVSPAGLSWPSSLLVLGGDARYLGVFWLTIG